MYKKVYRIIQTSDYKPVIKRAGDGKQTAHLKMYSLNYLEKQTLHKLAFSVGDAISGLKGIVSFCFLLFLQIFKIPFHIL